MGKKGTRRSFGAVRQRKSDRWQAWYTGPDGDIHRPPATFATKDDATAWLAAERKKIDLGAWTPPNATPTKGLTVAAYADRWHAETVNRHKPRTRALNRGYLDRQILPTLGDISLNSLTSAEVRAWHAGLEPQFATRNSNAYSLLRTILNQAVDDELISVNPCRVKRAATKHRKVEPVALSASEIRELAKYMPDRWQVLVLLAGFSGLRWGEIAALQRGDLDLKEMAVTVRRAVVYTDGRFVVDRPKSKAALRTVPLPDGLKPALLAHIKQWSASGKAGLLFPAAGGGYLHDGTPRIAFKAAATEIGHPKLRWHDLRHSAATLFAQQGATLADHMSLMGHTSSAMSARYTHSTASRTKGLVQGLWVD